ncbi:hypothetical protein CEXT_610031 [Caerostris extrusa]|uniref:Uncharacterized protein n=1 Tax=Caerostris extrusa TaxID=172846 RepID=A0AAV4XZD8_CAEEX|nr:hypothetical protein CEXT_610031 [Caerostris extrusa]
MGTWFERTAPWCSACLYRAYITSCLVTTLRRFSSLPDVWWPTKPSDSPPFLRCSRLVLHLIGLRHDTLGAVSPAPPRPVPCSDSGFSEMHERNYRQWSYVEVARHRKIWSSDLARGKESLVYSHTCGSVGHSFQPRLCPIQGHKVQPSPVNEPPVGKPRVGPISNKVRAGRSK